MSRNASRGRQSCTLSCPHTFLTPQAVHDATSKLTDLEAIVKQLETKHARLLSVTEELEGQRATTMEDLEAVMTDVEAKRMDVKVR